MEVDTRYERSNQVFKNAIPKLELPTPPQPALDTLQEVERLLSSYSQVRMLLLLSLLINSYSQDSSGRCLAVSRRSRGKVHFLQVTDSRTDNESLFSNLMLVVTARWSGQGQETSFRLLATRHRRQVKEVVVPSQGERLQLLGQLKATLAFFLQELLADRYVECSGAFDEESLVTEMSLDIRSLLVEAEGDRVVYRARTCPSLLLRGHGEVCEACSHLKGGQDEREHGEDGEQGEEEEDPGACMSQYLEVSMEDSIEEQEEYKPHMDYLNNLEVKPRTHLGILKHGLDSNPHQIHKPKLSYKKLIAMAIKDSQYKMLKLTDIYSWILARYPGFNANRTGFQNSVRHNLSLNKVFIKVNMPGVANNGKGNYWAINPKFEDASNSVPDPHTPQKALQQYQNFSQYQERPDMSIICSPQMALTNGVVRLAEDLPDDDSRDSDKVAKSLLSNNPNISITLQPRTPVSELAVKKEQEDENKNTTGEVLVPEQQDGWFQPASEIPEVGHDFSDGLVLDKPNFR